MYNRKWQALRAKTSMVKESYDEGFGPFINLISMYDIMSIYLEKISNNVSMQRQFPVLDDEILTDAIGQHFVDKNIKYTNEKFNLVHEAIMDTFSRAHPMDFPCYDLICDYMDQISVGAAGRFQKEFPELDDDTLADIIGDYITDDDDDYSEYHHIHDELGEVFGICG